MPPSGRGHSAADKGVAFEPLLGIIADGRAKANGLGGGSSDLSRPRRLQVVELVIGRAAAKVPPATLVPGRRACSDGRVGWEVLGLAGSGVIVGGMAPLVRAPTKPVLIGLVAAGRLFLLSEGRLRQL